MSAVFKQVPPRETGFTTRGFRVSDLASLAPKRPMLAVGCEWEFPEPNPEFHR
jgi:hypothetical protein